MCAAGNLLSLGRCQSLETLGLFVYGCSFSYACGVYITLHHSSLPDCGVGSTKSAVQVAKVSVHACTPTRHCQGAQCAATARSHMYACIAHIGNGQHSLHWLRRAAGRESAGADNAHAAAIVLPTDPVCHYRSVCGCVCLVCVVRWSEISCACMSVVHYCPKRFLPQLQLPSAVQL